MAEATISVTRILGSLGLVLVLIYFTVAGMKYLLNRRGLRLDSFRLGRVCFDHRARNLMMIESLVLEPGKAVHLVRAGQEAFLIGTAGATMILLGKVKLEEGEEVGARDDEAWRCGIGGFPGDGQGSQ